MSNRPSNNDSLEDILVLRRFNTWDPVEVAKQKSYSYEISIFLFYFQIKKTKYSLTNSKTTCYCHCFIACILISYVL